MTGLPLHPAANSGDERQPPLGPDHTPYQAIGGERRVRELTDRFYDAMQREPGAATILAMHADDLGETRDRFFKFLSGWLGGPQLFVQEFGHPRLRMRHGHVAVDEAARDAWLHCMTIAMDEMELTGELRRFLDGRFAHVADFMRNTAG